MCRLALILLFSLCFSASSQVFAQVIPPLEKLSISNQDFVTPTGKKVRLWGINLVEFYPDHATAQNFARNLAERGVNVVRWHKMLESNNDFNWINTQGGTSPITCLASYNYDANNLPRGTSRANPAGADAVAWDRFDFLNAELQRNGVYVMMGVEFQRSFTPADQSISSVSASDDAAWRNAVIAMNNWGNYLFNLDTGAYLSGTNMGDWQNTIDKWKMLPVIDERAARLYEEFLATLLNHVNPYTGVAYKNSTQIAAMEIINEFSSLYATLNGNRFDAAPRSVGAVSYFDRELQSKWTAFLAARGQSAFSLYNLTTDAQKSLAVSFLTGLDRAFMQRMQNKVRSLGAPINLHFSNLFRSEDDSKLDHDMSSLSEDHLYQDPFVLEGWTWDYTRHTFSKEGLTRDVLHDFVYDLASRKAFSDRPFFVGEFNMFDWYSPPSDGAVSGPSEIDEMHRTSMMVAAAAYGSLHNWAGLTWFAAMHGAVTVVDSTNQILGIGRNGWAVNEAEKLPARSAADRPYNYANYIGGMMQDGQQLDHMRTLGLMFRNRLVNESKSPITLVVDAPLPVDVSYPPPLKYYPMEGWQNISSIRKTYGVKPAGQDAAPFMTALPGNPLVADTGEIVKDVKRQQLTVASAQAEAFTGNFDSAPPRNLKAIRFPSDDKGKFGTVALVSADDAPLSASSKLIVSRTKIDISTRAWEAGPDIELATLKKAEAGQQWRVKYTRPRSAFPNPSFVAAPLDVNGAPTFIGTVWTEAELELVGRNFVDAKSPPAPLPPPPLPAPKLVAPLGTVYGNHLAFSWKAVPGATSYTLWANELTSPQKPNVVSMTVAAADANCAKSSLCVVYPGALFDNAPAQWWVKAIASDGVAGVASEAGAFAVSVATKPTPTAPAGVSTSRNPIYVWRPTPGATSYLVQLNNNDTGDYILQEVPTTACNQAQCSAQFPGKPLQPGTATFWIVAYLAKPVYAEVFSDPFTFSVR